VPPLLAPRVMVPLSECSSVVWVQGQITGSTLEVFADGVLVASGAAFGSNILMPLSVGVTLAPGASVAARQTLGGDVSPLSPDPV
jgi:hypothetical protein